MVSIKYCVAVFGLLSLQGCFVGEIVCRGLGHARESMGCRTSNGDSLTEDEGLIIGGPGGGTSPKSNQTGFVGQGFGLVRMMPEQLSQNIKTLGFFDGHEVPNTYTGDKLDLLTLIYGVPLGGLDFETSSRRDPLTKAQTVLVSRTVSYSFALQIFYKDFQRPAGERLIFTSCDINQDRPFGLTGDADLAAPWQEHIKKGEVRWRAQVDDLFWRFLSRPPTENEIGPIKDLFFAALEDQKWTGAGWAGLLYALLASEEFWHL